LVFAFVPIQALHFSPMGIGGLLWAFLVGGLGLLPLFFARAAHTGHSASTSPDRATRLG
jgi:hypothetical protein